MSRNLPGDGTGRDAGRAVRDVWRGPDGGMIVHEQQIEPRRWWNRVTRPLGGVMIVMGVAWPLILMAHGWPRLALGFAVADLCVIGTGRDLMRCGAMRWRGDKD